MKIDTCIIVDDSEQEIFLTGRFFKRAKVDLAICHYLSSQAILNASLERDEQRIRRSIIFIDRYLGYENGIELLQTLRGIEPLKFAIMGICSGTQNEADRVSAQKAGADFFVQKPLNVESLKELEKILPGVELCTSDEGQLSLVRR